MPGTRLKIYLTAVAFLIVFAAQGLFAATIDVVKVEGNRRIPASTILKNAVKPGSEFDMNAIDSSVKKIFESGMIIDVKVDMNVDDDKLTLTYIVMEKPYVNKVYIEGNSEIREDTIRDAIVGLENQLLDRRKIEANLKKIEEVYNKENFYASKVKSDVEERGNNTVDVIFSVEEGPEASIQKINFYGNDFYETDDLMDEMETNEEGFFSFLSGSGKLVRDQLDNDIAKLYRLYRNNGFAKVQIGEPEVILDESKKNITLAVRIIEGKRYRMGKIAFEGNKQKTTEELESVVTLKTGEFFNHDKFTKDIEKLTDQFTEIGYAYANVDPETSADEERATYDVTYKIDENVLVKINRINIRGNSNTRDRVIRREFDIHEGDIYNSTDIKNSKNNIQYTDYFEKVVISEDRVTDDIVDLNVDVEDKRTGQFIVGMGYSTVDNLSVMAKLEQKNLFGLGYKMNFTSEFTEKRTDYALYFTNPWLFDKPVSFGFGVFKSRRSYYEYTKKSQGFSLTFGHQLIKRKLFATYRYLFEDVEITDVDDGASDYIKDDEGTTKVRSITPKLTWDTRNHPYDPTAGNYLSGYVKYAGNGLGGDRDFYKTIIEGIQYFPMFEDSTIAIRTEGALAQPFAGNDLPIAERFRLGGIYTVRGYSFGSISPVDNDGEEYGGNKYVLANVEYIFPISKESNLKGAVFHDMGQAYKEGEEYFSGELKKSVGIEFRWYSPIGPLRLVYGRKINPEDNESTSRWDFTVGGMF